MFDLGWSELLVVGAVAIIVVGPNEMPRVVRSVAGVMRKVREMAGDFQSSMEDVANDVDAHEIKKQMLDSETKIQEMLSEQTASISSLDDISVENNIKKTVKKVSKKSIAKKMTTKKSTTQKHIAQKTITKSEKKK